MNLKGKDKSKAIQKTVDIWQFEDFDGFGSIQLTPVSFVISIQKPHPIKEGELIAVSVDGATWMGAVNLIDTEKSRDFIWVHAKKLNA